LRSSSAGIPQTEIIQGWPRLIPEPFPLREIQVETVLDITSSGVKRLALHP